MPQEYYVLKKWGKCQERAEYLGDQFNYASSLQRQDAKRGIGEEGGEAERGGEKREKLEEEEMERRRGRRGRRGRFPHIVSSDPWGQMDPSLKH